MPMFASALITSVMDEESFQTLENRAFHDVALEVAKRAWDS